jgi:hypothetical protein
MTPQTTPKFDDKEITDDEVLYRHCKTASQVSLNRDNGTYVLSNQVFAGLRGGCSIEIKSLLDRDGQTPEMRVHANDSFALVSITAGEVRTIEYTSDKKPMKGLSVAFTPIAGDQHVRANPYHGDIFPEPKESAKKALTRKAVEVVPVNQVRAAIEYAKKAGF